MHLSEVGTVAREDQEDAGRFWTPSDSHVRPIFNPQVGASDRHRGCRHLQRQRDRRDRLLSVADERGGGVAQEGATARAGGAGQGAV